MGSAKQVSISGKHIARNDPAYRWRQSAAPDGVIAASGGQGPGQAGSGHWRREIRDCAATVIIVAKKRTFYAELDLHQGSPRPIMQAFVLKKGRHIQVIFGKGGHRGNVLPSIKIGRQKIPGATHS
jgi:hypothetical protein